MTSGKIILAIFAHPDDEIGVGSTLAYYSDKGVRTVLVCATRGEVATIFCDGCATRETLAEVRTHELECACGHIGIHELRWLDWPDGGIEDMPRSEAIGQIVRQIREIRPDVIITHPEHGLYPHPDHLAIWEMVREAFRAAADEAAYPDTGPAFAPARLFTRALPQSIFEKTPGLADFRVELNGKLLPFFATPDNEIDVILRVEPWVERRMAAWGCHVSQHNPKGFSTTMPDGVRREMAANEHYLLAAARVPLPDGETGDLLAGIEPADPADECLSEAETIALRSELTRHRALIEVCEAYSRDRSAEALVALCRRLVELEQEIVYRLARALRLAGVPAGAVDVDSGLRYRGLQRTNVPTRAAFLRATFADTMNRYQAHVAAPHAHVIWSELLSASQAQAAEVAAFSG